MKPGSKPLIAIACGGTGGHLFPGLAVAGKLKERGCDVALLISPKEVDQQAVKSASNMEIFTLPAVGLQNRNYLSFAGNFLKSLFAARRIFRQRKPVAVLAMGGFTSAPPVLAAGRFGARAYLHESNTIPGKANRYLARFVHEAFTGFPEASSRLQARKVTHTGTPVRPEFRLLNAAERESAAAKLGLDAHLPAVLVMGGSQGASGLNTMVLSALPLLAKKNWQWLHLTGPKDLEKVKSAYAALGIKASVKAFLTEMDLALGIATAAVSRAGASSLAEIAAVRLPTLLVPFPAAADNHQFFNAEAYVNSGAARMIEQSGAPPEEVAKTLTALVEDAVTRSTMGAALRSWHAPEAAETIAALILRESADTMAERNFTGAVSSPADPTNLHV